MDPNRLDAKRILIDQIRDIAKFFVNDLGYIPAEKLGASPGGVARTPLDITVECAGINAMAAALLLGEVSNHGPEAHAQALAANDTLEKASQLLLTSAERLADAVAHLDEAGLCDEVTVPWGQKMTKYEVAGFAASHMSYHEGQLNYIQALYGDGEMHW